MKADDSAQERVERIMEQMRERRRRVEPVGFRIGVLVGAIIGLGSAWYYYGFPDNPYYTVMFGGFFVVAGLLWSISLSLENIARDLLKSATWFGSCFTITTMV